MGQKLLSFHVNKVTKNLTTYVSFLFDNIDRSTKACDPILSRYVIWNLPFQRNCTDQLNSSGSNHSLITFVLVS